MKIDDCIEFYRKLNISQVKNILRYQEIELNKEILENKKSCMDLFIEKLKGDK